MSIEGWLMIVGFVMAGYAFWFKDWKTKIEDKNSSLEFELSDHKNAYIKEKDNLISKSHFLELELSKRITRDEIDTIKSEIKTDFNEFKKELRTIISDGKRRHDDKE